jgi:hypothetical protein
MTRLNIVEQVITELADCLLVKQGICAASVPIGMGTSTIVADLVRKSDGRVRSVEAKSGVHASLASVLASIAPGCFARQVSFAFVDDIPDIGPVPIDSRKINGYLFWAFSDWLRRRPSPREPVLLVIDDSHELRSHRLADQFVKCLFRATRNRPVSLLFLGNETFTLPPSTALRLFPGRTSRYRIEQSRSLFDHFFTLTEDEIEDSDVAVMVERLGADPAYMPLLSRARRRVLFNVDYRNLARLIELGTEKGGAAALSEHDIAMAFGFDHFQFSAPAMSSSMPTS